MSAILTTTESPTFAADRLIADLMDGIEHTRDKLNSTVFGNFVLQWGNGLCVGLRDRNIGFATGFCNAHVFDDKDAAADWQLRHDIRNGNQERPVPVRAFHAGERTIEETEDLIEHFRCIVAAA